MANNVNLSPIDAKLDQVFYVPTNIIDSGLLSETTSALQCFTKQQFSAILQVYMVQYVLSVTSYQSVYK